MHFSDCFGVCDGERSGVLSGGAREVVNVLCNVVRQMLLAFYLALLACNNMLIEPRLLRGLI